MGAIMLTNEQIERYHRRGYLLLPDWFDNQEVDTLRAELPSLLNHDAPGRTTEADKKSVRIFYGVHQISPLFDALTRHPRMLPLAMGLLGEQVYVHQSKLNMKSGFQGSGFEWHQDFAFWHGRDGMPKPNVVNFIVFLDDVDLFNAPIYLLPGSHERGLAPSQGKELIPHDHVKELVAELGIEAATGPRGTLLVFGGLIAHASPPNISPFNRALALITYNAVSNVLTAGTDASHAHLAEREIVALASHQDDDILRRPAPPYRSRMEEFGIAMKA
jgi:ectoine hydroxylase